MPPDRRSTTPITTISIFALAGRCPGSAARARSSPHPAAGPGRDRTSKLLDPRNDLVADALLGDLETVHLRRLGDIIVAPSIRASSVAAAPRSVSELNMITGRCG